MHMVIIAYTYGCTIWYTFHFAGSHNLLFISQHESDDANLSYSFRSKLLHAYIDIETLPVSIYLVWTLVSLKAVYGN